MNNSTVKNFSAFQSHHGVSCLRARRREREKNYRRIRASKTKILFAQDMIYWPTGSDFVRIAEADELTDEC